jgi:hypothetical protein
MVAACIALKNKWTLFETFRTALYKNQALDMLTEWHNVTPKTNRKYWLLKEIMFYSRCSLTLYKCIQKSCFLQTGIKVLHEFMHKLYYRKHPPSCTKPRVVDNEYKTLQHSAEMHGFLYYSSFCWVRDV